MEGGGVVWGEGNNWPYLLKFIQSKLSISDVAEKEPFRPIVIKRRKPYVNTMCTFLIFRTILEMITRLIMQARCLIERIAARALDSTD